MISNKDISSFFHFSALVILLCPLGATAWKTLYVKPGGNDTNSGLSWAQARGTLSGARDLVRGLAPSMPGDIEVILAGGSYPVTNTQVFDERDSGRNGFWVIYQNAPGETPTLRGSEAVTQWKDAPWGGWWMNSVPLAFRARQLWANDKKAFLARTPNRGTYISHDLTFDTNGGTVKLLVASNQLPTWSPQHPVEIVFQMKWTESIGHIQQVSYVSNRAVLTLSSNESLKLFQFCRHVIDNNDRHSYYFQNSGNFLDAPGEFFMEGASLYYKGRPDETKTNLRAMVPQVTTLLRLQGTSPSNRVHHLVFRGIHFSETVWNEPGNMGFIDGQSSRYYRSNAPAIPPSAVVLENAESIDFEYCRFLRLGTSGLSLHKAVRGVGVEGCRFEDIAGTGLEIFSAGVIEGSAMYTNPNLSCDLNRVVNNYFAICGQDLPGSIPLSGIMGRSNMITHNWVTDSPYTGISWGWGWGSAPGAPLEANVIGHNLVQRAMETLADGAGIYTLEKQMDTNQGLELFENVLRDIRRSQAAHSTLPVCGVYFDEGTKNVACTSQVLSNVDIFQGDVIFNHSGGALESNQITLLNNYTQDPQIINRAGNERDFILTNWGPAPLRPQEFNLSRGRLHWANQYSLTHHPDRGSDNDSGSLWAAASGTIGVYTVALMGPRRVTRVELLARQDVDQPFARNNFMVEGSTNGQNYWPLVGQGSSSFPHQGLWVGVVTNSPVLSHVRVRKTDGSHFNFAEFRVWGR